ncbi:MAG: Si-specific NAD(P)(+) transhydrogenase [Isosphaeraceae bacterium]
MNTGTLPSKTLRETALFLSGFRHRNLEGLDLQWTRHPLTVRALMGREEVVVNHERERIRRDLARYGVTYYRGHASFDDPNTVRIRPVSGDELAVRGKVILIATGSHPHRPPGYAFEDPRIYDSDEILALERIPATMLVVGAGVIGCEYASMFAALGIKVTLLERRDRLISFLDAEISTALLDDMREQGVDVVFNDEVASVDDAPDPIHVKLKSGREMEFEAILVSSGRSGNTADLRLENVGLIASDRGALSVNDQYQTAIPHIYAAGDVIGFPALASTSMEQARIAMIHAFDLPDRHNLARILPYGIYTVPECSMAGATEEELKKQEIPYVVGKALYAHNARGLIIGDRHGFLKLLFRADDLKLLGVHIIGEQATELVHIGLTALMIGAGADLFLQTCFNHPTLTELYKQATFEALGRCERAQYPSVVGTLT